MSDLLKKPTNQKFTMELIEYMHYRIVHDELGEIGTVKLEGSPAKFTYKNDRVSGSVDTIGEATRALYFSKTG